MTTGDAWALLLAGIATIVGFLVALRVSEWREERRKAARKAAAEEEFWAALTRFVNRAYADFTPESETPIYDELAVQQLRADLDAWGR